MRGNVIPSKREKPHLKNVAAQKFWEHFVEKNYIKQGQERATHFKTESIPEAYV